MSRTARGLDLEPGETLVGDRDGQVGRLRDDRRVDSRAFVQNALVPMLPGFLVADGRDHDISREALTVAAAIMAAARPAFMS